MLLNASYIILPSNFGDSSTCSQNVIPNKCSLLLDVSLYVSWEWPAYKFQLMMESSTIVTHAGWQLLYEDVC